MHATHSESVAWQFSSVDVPEWGLGRMKGVIFSELGSPLVRIDCYRFSVHIPPLFSASGRGRRSRNLRGLDQRCRGQDAKPVKLRGEEKCTCVAWLAGKLDIRNEDDSQNSKTTRDASECPQLARASLILFYFY